MVKGPVSAEVVATDFGGMMREAEVLRKLADNIAVKVPLTIDGLKACKAFSDQGVRTNLTLCFQPLQALMVAKAGASSRRSSGGRRYRQPGIESTTSPDL